MTGEAVVDRYAQYHDRPGVATEFSLRGGRSFSSQDQIPENPEYPKYSTAVTQVLHEQKGQPTCAGCPRWFTQTGGPARNPAPSRAAREERGQEVEEVLGVHGAVVIEVGLAHTLDGELAHAAFVVVPADADEVGLAGRRRESY